MFQADNLWCESKTLPSRHLGPDESKTQAINCFERFKRRRRRECERELVVKREMTNTWFHAVC